MKPFTASRIAILCNDKLVVILRDDKPEIAFPSMWEFPGGRRESNETPEQCAFREVYEELGVSLSEECIIWKKEYLSDSHKGKVAYFFVSEIPQDTLKDIKLGNEGEAWATMSIEEFMTHPKAIPKLKIKFSDYLERNNEQNQAVLTTPAAARPTS